MVKGLDQFKRHFEGYADHYVLIGGSACDVRFTDKALSFRLTKDLDLILIVEALTNDFVLHYWDFIRAGGYELAQVDSQRRFYRFIKPTSEDYPYMLELFARRPDALPHADGLHITDIPTGEEVSSLSAILLDDAYYHFTLSNSEIIDGLHVANDIALISLKAKAFLNNQQRRREGQPVRDVDIIKHKNDVIRLTATITGIASVDVIATVKNDITGFIEILQVEPDNINQVLRSSDLPGIGKNAIIEQLRRVFGIEGGSVTV